MNKHLRVFVAGHTGLVGSAIVRRLQSSGHENVVLRRRMELDLTSQVAVEDFFVREQIDCVFLAAAKVGGIHANSIYPADFIRENLQIQTNVIDSAYRHGVSKLVFLGSSCVYPRLAPQPIRENSLLTGPLETTNEAYAIAKIAGLKMCEAYRRQFGFDAISLMPTNLYGPGDNFDLTTSHVLPALIRKFHEAAKAGAAAVEVWGSGEPRREFLHVDDMADAAVYLAEHYSAGAPINVGYGSDLAISELAELVRTVVGFRGEIAFDRSQPDGTPRKLTDSSQLRSLGWSPKITLADGIRSTYEWYLEHCNC